MRKAEPWFRLVELLLRPPLALWFDWRFEGLERVPREGPVLVAANHISYFDPLAHAYLLVRAGRRPRFLAKRELFDHPLLGRILQGTGQIPVERGSGSQAPLEEAARALRRGEAVVVYPEATVTRDPERRPMQGKTGVARLALATGVPVLPVAVWGSHRVWQRGGPRSLRFGRPIWLRVGEALDLSALAEGRDDPAAVRRLTERVMAALAELVEDLRARYPKRWDR
ncbi:MAG TPA: lysophospholipid acyltransferase family protein [Actinomycetota bacterium]|nr:lysophospholipid acyltransferase family protein [Actinomycetota bacterium]